MNISALREKLCWCSWLLQADEMEAEFRCHVVLGFAANGFHFKASAASCIIMTSTALCHSLHKSLKLVLNNDFFFSWFHRHCSVTLCKMAHHKILGSNDIPEAQSLSISFPPLLELSVLSRDSHFLCIPSEIAQSHSFNRVHYPVDKHSGQARSSPQVSRLASGTQV